MYLHFGQRPYGKCDVVPELFYVSTWFFQINFVPVVPLGTRLILGQSGTQYHVIHIPFSFKSLVLAWTRATTLFGTIVLPVISIIAYSEHHRLEDAAGFALAAACCIVLFAFVMIYPVRKKPTYKRACQLAQLAGLNERGWAALNVLYNHDPFDRPSNPEH